MKQYQAFVPASLNPDELIKPSSKTGKRLTYQESEDSPAQIDSGTKKKSNLEEQKRGRTKPEKPNIADY